MLEIETRAAEATLREKERREAAIDAKLRAEEAAKQREIDFKNHLKEAWQRLFEARRAKELRSQASAWAEASALSAYCDAVEDAHGDDPEARRWLEWARGFIEKLDPLDKPPSLPEITEAPEDELQQYMLRAGVFKEQSIQTRGRRAGISAAEFRHPETWNERIACAAFTAHAVGGGRGGAAETSSVNELRETHAEEATLLT